MARLSLTLFGGFRAGVDSGAPLALPTRKAQALLAYLAVPTGLAHPRDKLASLLWGSTVETTARTSLRQTLYALRRNLRGIDRQPLRVDGETVALDPGAVTVDVGEFEQRVAQATPSALAEAAALYQGELLEGLTVQEPPFEDWLAAQRERLRELALGALARLFTHQRAHYRKALTLAAPRGMRPLVAHCHLGLGKLHSKNGKREQAREHLTVATTLYREMGMAFWLEKGGAELHALA